MKPPAQPANFQARRFRVRLVAAMTLVVSVSTALILYFAERGLALRVERELQQKFRGELAVLHNVQALREAALLERCRALVRKPRIHAALEDGALDLLYPSARDELRDVMAAVVPGAETTAYALHAQFYRFHNRQAVVIAPASGDDTGDLLPEDAARLTLPRMPEGPQMGYLARRDAQGREFLSEVIAMPIASGETGDIIAALVLGFKPAGLDEVVPEGGIRRGIWLGGRLHLPGLAPQEAEAISAQVAGTLTLSGGAESSFMQEIGGMPYQIFCKQLNPGALYPPASEVCIYPLGELAATKQRLRLQFLGAGLLFILGGFGVSHVISSRLSKPVEKLAVDSEHNLAERTRVEAALETTNEELQRAARFSADASHQLKTPVAVLRAGLEELQARQDLAPEVNQELAALVHQTYRLSSVIDDLLLLSRMDAGQLKLKFTDVALGRLIAAALDALGTKTDDAALSVESDFPDGLSLAGDPHYLSLILQNLLENARKYNRPGGRIRLSAGCSAGRMSLRISNTGPGITPAAREHIFERFHRGAVGENIPGYGLGLNLARELARLHMGDLRLVKSEDDWTEFELTFPASRPARA